MSVVEIVKIPNKILVTPAKEVDVIDPEVVQNLRDTIENAKNPEAAGLAGPQINVPLRICVVRKYANDNTSHKEYILINPTIYSYSKEKEIDLEGCMSIPNTYGMVERPKKIKVKALDEFGKEQNINASGFFARVIQHEIDHLNGILFTSKVLGRTYTEKEIDDMITKKQV